MIYYKATEVGVHLPASFWISAFVQNTTSSREQ